MSSSGDLRIINVDSDDNSQSFNYASLLVAQLKKHGYSAVAVDLASNREELTKGQDNPNEVYREVALCSVNIYNLETKLKRKYDSEEIIIVYNSLASSLARVSERIKNAEERRGLYLWFDNFSYQILGLTRPVKNLTISSDNETYYEISKLFPKDFENIEPKRDGKLISSKDLGQLLFQRVQPLLPITPSSNYSGNEDKNKKSSVNIGQVSFSLQKLLGGIRDVSISIAGNAQGVYLPKDLSQSDKEMYKDYLSKILSSRQKIMSALSRKKGVSEVALKNIVDSCTPLSLTSAVTLKIHSGNDSVHRQLSKSYEGREILKLLSENKSVGNKQGEPVLELSSSKHSRDSGKISVISYSPRNELDILSDIIYSTQGDNYTSIFEELNLLTYKKRASLYDKYLLDSAASPAYTLEGLTSYASLSELNKSSTRFASQAVSPRFGYDVPELIEALGLTDDYIECFDLSLSIYSKLQGKYSDEVCSYVCLGGHKTRWLANFDVGGLSSLYKNKDKGFLTSIDDILSSIEEKHPLTVEVAKKVKRGNIS